MVALILFEGFSLSDGMIIDQSRRKKIYLDTKKKRAVIEPGVLLGPLADQLSKYGLDTSEWYLRQQWSHWPLFGWRNWFPLEDLWHDVR